MAFPEDKLQTLRQEYEHIKHAFHSESDRGAALIAAEFFDTTLEKLLRARFSSGLQKRRKLVEPLFEGFGPLSTFSAKIRISYAIDLLQDWMASDLDIIRGIRNEFAHRLEPKNFRDPKISKMVGELASYDRGREACEKMVGPDESNVLFPASSDATPRSIFTAACVRTGTLLQVKVVILESDGRMR